MSDGEVVIRWSNWTRDTHLPSEPLSTGTLADRIAAAGRPLNTRCGQRGLCSGCTVHLATGAFEEIGGVVVEGPRDIKACRGHVPPEGNALIVVPERSIAAHRPQIVMTFKAGVSAAHDPVVPVTSGIRDHGLAIDIGTTTVVVALVDLHSGRIVSESSALNRQVDFGEDVVTRIGFAGSGRLGDLRRAITERTLTPLIRRVCAVMNLNTDRLAGAVVAGNPTMLHLLAGVDPTPMGVAPFRAVFIDHRIFGAGKLGLTGMPSEAPVHLLPGFGAYVGADVLAGCVCAGMLADPGPSLFVDIGTNGEILLCHGERLLATATAAGPAFEGSSLARGMRAASGAVGHVTFPEDRFPPRLDLVPGSPRAVGLCGSAYVDFLAEGRRIGFIRPNGRFDDSGWMALSTNHRYANGVGRGVRLRPGDGATLVTEADIAQLLKAKAAIAAGIATLLKCAGLVPGEIRRLRLAGGFGMHIDVARAIGCGLLSGFQPAQIDVVGNTSLGGAWLALVDRTILSEMAELRHRAEIVELNLSPGFEDLFIEHLALP